MKEFNGMLAQQGDDTLLCEYEKMGWVAEPKYDGIRFIATVKNGKIVSLVSRGGLDDKENYRFAQERIFSEPINCILDGEIIYQVGTELWQTSLAEIQAINGSHPARALRMHQDNVKFVLFDILSLEGESLMDLTYRERRAKLEEIGKKIISPQVVVTLATVAIRMLHRKMQETNGEGIMLKWPNSRYQCNKRSSDWLKVKFTEVSEAVIVGSVPGNGKNTGLVGSVMVIINESGRRFPGKFGAMSDEMRKEISDFPHGRLKPSFLDRKVLVRYYPGGVKNLRHCQFEGWVK